MRRFILGLGLLGVLAAESVRGQTVAQEFSGTGETTTPMFTVGDRWEVRWNARQAVSIAALSSNGTLVAGASGVLRGSLFVPSGGQYYLKITDGTVAPPAPATNAAPGARTNAVPEPAPIVPEIGSTNAPVVAWHVQVIQLASTVSSTDSLTVFAPYFTVPNAAITVPSIPPPPAPILSPDQVSALVTLKGDNLQGSGFFLRNADGVYVVAHVRLLANNPNLQITTSTGAPVKILSMKAASDRNLALIAVQDDHYKCLKAPVPTDPAAALADYVIVPVLGQTDLTAAKVGRIINLGAERIDFDAPVDISSNSAPVIDVASGKVLGIVTGEKRVDLTVNTSKAWLENPVPGAEAISPYFGLSLSNVPGWEALDLASFDRESQLLTDFHNITRCLDSFLNGPRRSSHAPSASPYEPPDSRTYKSNSDIAAANDTFHRQASASSSNLAPDDQTIDATRELLDDLQSIAKSGIEQLQATSFSYGVNRRRAQEELAYRQAIQVQLTTFADDIPKLSSIAQSR